MNGQENMDDTGKTVSVARRGALVLVLGLLCLLAAIATANAYVTKTTQTSIDDFALGTFQYTGLVDLPNDVEGVQLLPMGIEGGGWTRSNLDLPEALSNLIAVASDGRIYVAGGDTPDFEISDKVWVTEVNPDGSLAGWREQDPMPTGRAAAGYAVHELNSSTSILYVVGGAVPEGGYFTVLTDTIATAQIDRTTGDLQGGWQVQTRRLPIALENPSVVVHDDALYVIGGLGDPPPGEDVYNKVLYAPIDVDGSLGDWVETEPLAETGHYYGLAVVYEGDTTDTIYYIGGMKILTGSDEPTLMVQFADFLPDGELTAWTSQADGNLPRTLYGHSGVYLSDAFEYGEILLTGGIDNYREGEVSVTEAISSVVKVALVDPASSFRLYDWCQGASEEECDIGAWQTGMLLDESVAEDGRRAFHRTVAVGDYVYVLGGEGPDPDGEYLETRDTIFVGAVGDVEAMYVPQGQYESAAIDLERPATLLQLAWDTTITRVDEMSLTLEYRYRSEGMVWSDWSDPVTSIHGTNIISITSQTSHPENMRYFQYRVDLGTKAPLASPRLDSVQLYYDVADPDLAVIKDTGYVISVPLGSNLVYNIHYENNGGWDAENVELTETLPDNTTFAGTEGWEQVGTSNEYTYQLGDVPWGEGGTVQFGVVVNGEVPANTTHITNRVEIDYPAMLDIWSNTIIDPYTDDNAFEFSNELNFQKRVDLILRDLAWEPADPEVGTWPEFCVTVVNTGTADAMPPPEQPEFWVELYIKPNPSEPPAWPSDHDWGWCLGDPCVTRDEYTADISQLLAGESEQVCFQPQVPDPLALDYPAEGVYDVYVQVDVAFGVFSAYYGCFDESNEDNNILHETIIVSPSRIYLPMVFRAAP